LKNIIEACHHSAHEDIRSLLLQAPTGFVPKMAFVIWFAMLKKRCSF
jgi:hypothetical protein